MNKKHKKIVERFKYWIEKFRLNQYYTDIKYDLVQKENNKGDLSYADVEVDVDMCQATITYYDAIFDLNDEGLDTIIIHELIHILMWQVIEAKDRFAKNLIGYVEELQSREEEKVTHSLAKRFTKNMKR